MTRTLGPPWSRFVVRGLLLKSHLNLIFMYAPALHTSAAADWDNAAILSFFRMQQHKVAAFASGMHARLGAQKQMLAVIADEVLGQKNCKHWLSQWERQVREQGSEEEEEEEEKEEDFEEEEGSEEEGNEEEDSEI